MWQHGSQGSGLPPPVECWVLEGPACPPAPAARPTTGPGTRSGCPRAGSPQPAPAAAATACI